MTRKNASTEELAEIGIIEEKDQTQFFDKKGLPCSENSAVAKITGNSYGIKYRRGELFDPYGIDELKANAQDTKYKRVDQSVFEQYMKYLQTRRTAYSFGCTPGIYPKGILNGKKKGYASTRPNGKPVEPTLTHSLFVHKKDRGVTVMTKEASMMADETAESRKPQVSSRYKDCIHKIRED